MGYLKGIILAARLSTLILPLAEKELGRWKRESGSIRDEELKKQAQASIDTKKFHIQGGCVYALYPGANTVKTVRFITALQTISDYLDNLCDRAGVYDPEAFRQLHLSMLDAVDPDRSLSSYYSNYPVSEDGKYLEKLVLECKNQAKGLPSYNLALPYIKKYVGLYSELQTYKHAETEKRLDMLTNWAKEPLREYPDLNWWEFAAAAGSTLGIFLLFALAHNPKLTPEEIKAVDAAYFPWVCGLHILLDYFVDYQEDFLMGDLNFTYYYDNLKHCEERIVFFINKALEACSGLKHPAFHTTVVNGLLALYLSDPKTCSGFNRIASRNLLNSGGRGTMSFYRICSLLRLVGVI